VGVSGLLDDVPAGELRGKLEKARRELLELSTRNRLLSIPRQSKTARLVEVVDELSTETLRLLVADKKSMYFDPAPDVVPAAVASDGEAALGLAQPIDDDVDERGVARRHRDNRLQTRLASTTLQQRLLSLYYDANTAMEEQGVNILYVCVGTLHWHDSKKADTERIAPLLLVPAKLDRKTATSRFAISWTEEDVAENVTLREKLREFGVTLPSLEDARDDGDDWALTFARYIEAVRSAVSDKPGWSIHADEIYVGLFSFAKHLMYRDLAPESWAGDALLQHPLITGLFGGGFAPSPPADELNDEAFLDDVVPAARMTYVVDADSSQITAVEQARRGTNLVIQGPPGTGKSQSIANLIAALVADGKTVLFVAEKMAALEVVKRRLDRAGLGRVALELHSNKTNKKTVLDELLRTFQLHETSSARPRATPAELEQARARLTAYARELHRRHEPSGLNAYEIYGSLLAIRQRGEPEGKYALDPALTRDVIHETLELASRLGIRLTEVGDPTAHPLRELRPERVLEDSDIVDVAVTLRQLRERYAQEVRAARMLADVLHQPVPSTDHDVGTLLALAHVVEALPNCDIKALQSPAWTRGNEIGSLLAAGERAAQKRSELASREGHRIRQLADAARAVLSTMRVIRDVLAVDLALVAEEASSLQSLAIRLLTAPECEPRAMRSPAWERREELRQAIETTRAVAEAERRLNGVARDELPEEREIQAAINAIREKGGSLFRVFFGRYRHAIRFLRVTMLVPDGMPRGQKERLAVLEDLRTRSAGRRQLASTGSLAQDAFGAQWKGRDSDWELLAKVFDWRCDAQLPAAVLGALERRGELTAHREVCERLGLDVSRVVAGFAGLCRDLDLAEPADATLASISHADESTSLIDAAIERTEDGRLLQQQDALGREAFGAMWRGVSSDWEALQLVLAWRGTAGVDAVAAVQSATPATVRSAREALRTAAQQTAATAARLQEQLAQREELRHADHTEFTALLERWNANVDRLPGWSRYLATRQQARTMGLSQLADDLEARVVAPEHARVVVEASYLHAVLRRIRTTSPSLANFDGLGHEQAVQRFRSLDEGRQEIARDEVLSAHSSRRPTGKLGPMGVLRGEFAKKRRHLALRQLLSTAGPAVQDLKPVFMMSPLSVAQFLEPNALTFDVVIMDEASQIQPVDAIGAVARARQLVVVGDEKQMPPTRFFMRAMSEDGDGSKDELEAGDVESILGLCEARGLTARMLRWHYRSKHQSLIAVSNYEYYDSKLFIVPSPYTSTASMGLRFHHLPNAVYDRGGSATNVVEARTVAAAVIRHARESPGQTLGVATFSLKQRQLILDELERLRRENPDTEPFFSTAALEPFFVKNLENVQGDERDVIFISVCYGRDASGYMTMNFGPLSGEGGHRRLNVLISRARQRCEVFSPIVADDIDLGRTGARGAKGLKAFLQYAATGILDIPRQTGGEAESPFEEDVARCLRAEGYEVHHQVGQSGFFIDLAVVDREAPGRYLLGIECDGAAYHSSRSARDRDRLRQAVLEDHGWLIHRIWSTEWFRHQPSERQKLLDAIRDAPRRHAERPTGVSVAPVEGNVEPLPALEAPPVFTPVSTAYREGAPYEQAMMTLDSSQPLHEVPVARLATVVKAVVEVEGPVHRAEVTTRIRDLRGASRAGNRIQAAVNDAIDYAARAGWISVEDPFLDVPGRAIRVRSRTNVASAALKRPDMLPPSEVRAAVLELLDENGSASREELVVATSRLLGFASVGSQLRKVIEQEMSALIASGRIDESGGSMKVRSRG
jgi:very-short-patch-repair endonuclease